MDIEYKVIYSGRKTVALTNRGEEVIVRAPYKTSIKYISELVEAHRDWILSKLDLQKRKRDKEGHLTTEDITKLKNKARVYFTMLIERYSKLMGLKCSRIRITSAKKRFGSCNSKGTICFSYRLMLYPEAAREYVVVHELSHLVELNHSKAFYDIVKRYMPDYKERRKLLS